MFYVELLVEVIEVLAIAYLGYKFRRLPAPVILEPSPAVYRVVDENSVTYEGTSIMGARAARDRTGGTIETYRDNVLIR